MSRMLILVLFITCMFSSAYADDMVLDDDYLYQDDYLYDEEKTQNIDPLETANRGLYQVHKVLDKMILAPTIALYDIIVPEFGKQIIHNVVNNLQTPIYAVNYLLQGDVKSASNQMYRFMINSGLGLGGIMDFASYNPNLYIQTSNFGSTLNKYYVPDGPYLFIPLLGPTNLRNGFGAFVDSVLLNSALSKFEGAKYLQISILLDKRYRNRHIIESLDDVIGDEYLYVRSLYMQNKNFETSKILHKHDHDF